MSEEDGAAYSSVLLPGATIALFSRDENTKAAFASLAQDWRFARVKQDIHDGDVSTATALYAQTPSPDLVVIQTEEIDDGLAGRLEDLAGCCREDTAAIVIGPDNDVNLYRKLIAMGVSDYLVKPVDPVQLADDVAASLLEQIGAAGSTLITLMGTKGGTGVTVLSEALACGLAEELGHKTFLLDAAGGWSNLSVGLGFEPGTTLHEAVRAATEGNEDSLSRMIYKIGDKLSVLSSGADSMLDDSVSGSDYEALLDYLMATWPVVVVDLSGAAAALRRTVLAKAHKIILVTTPTLPSVRAARSLMKEIKDLRGGADRESGANAVEIILNMQGFSARHEVPKAQIEEGLDCKLSLAIPFEPSLFVKTESEAARLGRDNKAGKDVLAGLVGLAQKILPGRSGSNASEKSTGQSGLAGMMTLLKAKK